MEHDDGIEGAMAFSKVPLDEHACGADQSDFKLHHGTLNAVILLTILDFIEIKKIRQAKNQL